MRILNGLKYWAFAMKCVRHCWDKTLLRCTNKSCKLMLIIQVSFKEVIVQDHDGREIVSQLLPLTNFSLNTRNYHVRAYLGVSPGNTPSYWLAFSAFVPPLGFSTYIISRANKTGCPSSTLFYRLISN